MKKISAFFLFTLFWFSLFSQKLMFTDDSSSGYLVNPASFAQPARDTNFSLEVQSVYLTRSGIDLERPFLPMAAPGEQQEQMLLRFDILSDQEYHLGWRIRHCTIEWETDDLPAGEFINGPDEGNIENSQFSFTTRKDYVNYYQLVPDPYSLFVASGNYLLEVFPTDNPDSVLFTRRFCVYENLVDIGATIGKPSRTIGNFNRDQEIDIEITPRKGSFLIAQPEYYHVMVQQNRRNDLCRTVGFYGFSGGTMQYQWSAGNVFPGGNNYRYFDLSNIWASMYHVQRIEQLGGEIFAFLQPEEDRSGKNYTQYNSLNGGMKTNVRDRSNPHIEADYVWVNFSLPMERPFLNGSIHIVGDITRWSLGDDSRMEWNAKYKAYTKRMLLKQGYYSYQLLFLPTGEREALTATLEGDHAVTPNNYTVYVYYRSPGARYDRLVALRQFSSQ